MKVQIYTKPECCLCDEAKAVLSEVRRRVPFTLEEVNIESSPALFEKFRYDIPVVFIDGQRAFKHRLEPTLVEQRLRRAGGTLVAP